MNRSAEAGWARSDWACGVAVAGVTALAFSRSIALGFVAWDDEILLVRNPAFRGFGWVQLSWMTENALLGHWVPITWLSFALDHAVWGLHSAGYHLTNVLLHAVNAGLVCILAVRLLQRATTWPGDIRRLGAFAAALLWGLHPLRVEAVSWVTGRRDVLSALFLCLALGAWLRATEREGPVRRRWLAAAVGAYALALGAKSVVMMAPLAMVALDVYPLRRLPSRVRSWREIGVRDVWLEKLPFLALALLGATASALAVSRGIGYQILGPREWLGTVAVTLALPVWKTVVPLGLSPLYELPNRIDLGEPRYLGSAGLVVALTAGAVALRRRWPGGLTGWVWYAAFLAPVSAIAHAGPQLTADRYSYLPALSLTVLAGALVAAAVHADRSGRARAGVGPAVVLVAIVALIGVSGLSWRQQGKWRDAGTLWAHAVRVAPECMRCHVNLGSWLAGQGRLAEALAHYERALELDPRRIELNTNVGLALVRLGRPADAVARYERVLAHYPERVAVRVSLAAALVAAERLPEAVLRLDEAARFSSPTALVDYFQQLVAAQPGAPVPRLGLFQAYARVGDHAPAREAWEALAGLHPALARASDAGGMGARPPSRP